MLSLGTDSLGRTYEYPPHSPGLLAEAEIAFSSEVTLALAEASRALGSVTTESIFPCLTRSVIFGSPAATAPNVPPVVSNRSSLEERDRIRPVALASTASPAA